MTRQGPSKRTRRAQRLLIGPWIHEANKDRRIGEVDFGPEALINLTEFEVRWLDHWVRGSDNGVDTEPQVRLFVMSGEGWRDEHEWPLGRTAFTPYYLRSSGNANSRFGDGTLLPNPPAADEPADVYQYDPRRPVPFIYDPVWFQLGGPDDYSAIEQRGDVLVYTGPVLTEDLEVTGPVRGVLHASSSALDTDFTMKLLDVHPSGFSQRLCDGVVRGRFRNGLEGEELLKPDSIYQFKIDMRFTSHVLRMGHRIRVEVASSAFPKVARNTNTGKPLATDTEIVVAENCVWHTPARPSHIVLPIIPT
jgi:hypothetical protein